MTRHDVALYVCTYRRNEPLRRLLESLTVAAAEAADRVRLAVVVVDDNTDGRAKDVVAGFEPVPEGGLHYRHVGQQNISIARNTGLEACLELDAEWVAMVDDDVVVPADWFHRIFDLQERTGCDAVTGPLKLGFEEHGADWLRDQPFDQVGLMSHPEESVVGECATGNSILRARFLRDHPEIRFDPALGKVGGEDMVFYRAAVDAGLEARFTTAVAVTENEPADRSTYRYQLSRSLWIGNTEFVTNFRRGTHPRWRLAVRGLRRLSQAVSRPLSRLRAGDDAQWHYAGALAAQGVGLLVGAAGRELAHR